MDQNRSSSGTAGPRVAVTAQVVQEGTEYILKLKIKNKGADALKGFKHALPWGGRYSMTVIAVETSTIEGRPLPPVHYIDDPTTAQFSIPAHGEVSGSVSLSKRFPSLAEALSRKDVEVFWGYQLPTIEQKRANRVGGWILVPKTNR
jgi:hypothetical protein